MGRVGVRQQPPAPTIGEGMRAQGERDTPRPNPTGSAERGERDQPDHGLRERIHGDPGALTSEYTQCSQRRHPHCGHGGSGHREKRDRTKPRRPLQESPAISSLLLIEHCPLATLPGAQSRNHRPFDRCTQEAMPEPPPSPHSGYPPQAGVVAAVRAGSGPRRRPHRCIMRPTAYRGASGRGR